MKNIKTLSLLVFISLLSCGKEKPKTIENTEFVAVKLYKLNEKNTPKLIETNGLISTENETKLSFKIGGVIDKIYVEEGDFIKKGQLLATLKTTEINAQVAQATLNLEKTKRDFERTKRLFKDNVVTLEQLENTKTAFEVAKKSLQQAVFNQKYARIEATASGFISMKMANEGEIVQGGFPVFLSNESEKQKNWVVKAGISEQDWTNVEINNTCKVTINGKEYGGTVKRNSQAMDPVSGTFQIEIALNNVRETLAVGMFAKVTIESAKIKKGIVVPYDAMVEADGLNAFVFVPTSDSTVRKIPIVIDHFNEKEVHVIAGLDKIREVVVGNSPFLNAQSKIKIIK
jgi:RND family efflux transporter MFP subunit